MLAVAALLMTAGGIVLGLSSIYCSGSLLLASVLGVISPRYARFPYHLMRQEY